MSVEAEDDSDVVWQGSPLYSHLLEHGMLEDDTSVEKRPEDKIVINSPPSLENEVNEQVLPVQISQENEKTTTTQESVLLCSARSYMWPDESSLVMEVRVARSVLESELLVQEDEEFLNNFILNEEVWRNVVHIVKFANFPY